VAEARCHTGRSTAKKAKFWGSVVLVHLLRFIGFGRNGAMGLSLVLVWCAALARGVLRYNSRFGVFNSRLGANEFPFKRQREFTSNGLISLAFFGAETALCGQNRKNSRFHGNKRQFRVSCETGGRATYSGADLPRLRRHDPAQSATVLSERVRALGHPSAGRSQGYARRAAFCSASEGVSFGGAVASGAASRAILAIAWASLATPARRVLGSPHWRR
jgi:hypothetical protein